MCRQQKHVPLSGYNDNPSVVNLWYVLNLFPASKCKCTVQANSQNHTTILDYLDLFHRTTLVHCWTHITFEQSHSFFCIVLLCFPSWLDQGLLHLYFCCPNTPSKIIIHFAVHSAPTQVKNLGRYAVWSLYGTYSTLHQTRIKALYNNLFFATHVTYPEHDRSH